MINDTIWQLYPKQASLSKKIASYFNCLPIIGQLMLNRSIHTIKEAEHFMHQTWDNWDPLPNQPELMKQIEHLINDQAAICVYGDYDVDGVTSTAMLVGILRNAGCQVDYISPHRFNDGYGLNINRINEIAKKNYAALITIDCGVSNHHEIEQLKKQQPTMVVLIIDHHKCPAVLPNATAIVNPQLATEDHPARHLCSAALIDYIFRTTPIHNIDPSEYLDLCALGLIADVMPLTNLNRWYVNQGLTAIRTKPRPVILELCIQARINHETINTKDVGFGLGPRMNAPGRLGDPRPVVELLLSTDITDIKSKIQAIEKLNNKRRNIGEKIQKDIEEQLDQETNLDNQKGIICSGQYWHMGVIGINASKLVNKFHKPAIVIGFENDIARGSARSIPGVNIYNIIQKCAEALDHFGGHSQAAGFSLKTKNIVEFKKEFLKQCNSINKESSTPKMIIDAELPLNQINLSLIDELAKLEPHGEANPKPVFYTSANLIDAKKVGKTSAHLKCRLEQNGSIIDGIGFNLATALAKIKSQKISIAFTVSKNIFRGNVTPQVEIIEIK